MLQDVVMAISLEVFTRLYKFMVDRSANGLVVAW